MCFWSVVTVVLRTNVYCLSRANKHTNRQAIEQESEQSKHNKHIKLSKRTSHLKQASKLASKQVSKCKQVQASALKWK